MAKRTSYRRKKSRRQNRPYKRMVMSKYVPRNLTLKD